MSSRFSTRLLVLCTALLAGPVSANGTERLRLSVSPTIAMAPATLRVQVRIAPDAANRSLAIVADGENYYRSSLLPLDGDRAASTLDISYPGVPGGTYEVLCVLLDSSGHQRATARVEISVQQVA